MAKEGGVSDLNRVQDLAVRLSPDEFRLYCERLKVSVNSVAAMNCFMALGKMDSRQLERENAFLDGLVAARSLSVEKQPDSDALLLG